MNFITRLLLILAVITLLVGATVLLVSPQAVIALAEGLNSVDTAGRAIQLLLALLIDLLLLGLLYQLLRRTASRGLMVRARGARTEVSIDSVRRQIMAQIAQLPDVLDVQTEVRAERGNARVALRVKATPDITVPDKQNEINRALRQVVEKQMGLRLAGPPVIHIELQTGKEPLEPPVEAPAPLVPRPTPRPQPEPLPAPPVAEVRPAEPEKPAPPAAVVVVPEPAPAPGPHLVALEPADEDEETGIAPVAPAVPGWRDDALDGSTMRLGEARAPFDHP